MTLTFSAHRLVQCVIRRTYDPKYDPSTTSCLLVHSLAQSTAETGLPQGGKGAGLESA